MMDSDVELRRRLAQLEQRTGQIYDQVWGTLVPLNTPIAVFSPQTFSTVAVSTEITSATMGTPTTAKALLVSISVRDSGAAAKEFDLGPSSAYYYALQCVSQVTNQYMAYGPVTVPTSVTGSLWYQCTASGANTLSVYLRIWGYVL